MSHGLWSVDDWDGGGGGGGGRVGSPWFTRLGVSKWEMHSEGSNAKINRTI